MATLGNPINAATVGQRLTSDAGELLNQYEFLKKLSGEYTQNVGTSQLQTSAGITDGNEVFQINSMLAAINALISCFENGLAQPGFNIPSFCEQVVGMAG